MSVCCIVVHDENKQKDFKTILQNPFTKNCRLLTAEGRDMGTAYNEVIRKHSLGQAEGWIVFCKPGFGFCESLDLMTDKLKTNCIYGPSGFKIKLRKLHKGILRVGRFFRGDRDGVFNKVGKTVIFPAKVIYLDYNCFIMHSSIIEKYTISFPEGLEDGEMLKTFCRNLRKHRVHSMAIPVSCYEVNPDSIPLA